MRSMRPTILFMLTFLTYVVLVNERIHSVSHETAPVARPATGDARIERGAHLVRTMGCNDCHTPWKVGPRGPAPDMSRSLTGHPADLVMPPAPVLPPGPWAWVGAATNTAFAGPWGVSFAANLTPDPETGLGKWTESMFIADDEDRTARGQRPCAPPADAVSDHRIAARRRHPFALRLPSVAAAGPQPRAAARRRARVAVGGVPP